MTHYDWGYHSPDAGHVHVARVEDGGHREDLFDVALYDVEVIDPSTGLNCQDQSLVDLKGLLAHANLGVQAEATVERLKADLAYHQNEAARITREVLDIDTAPEGSYTAEDDCAESYHTGRVEALSNVLDILNGRREVVLYSEKQGSAS